MSYLFFNQGKLLLLSPIMHTFQVGYKNNFGIFSIESQTMNALKSCCF